MAIVLQTEQLSKKAGGKRLPQGKSIKIFELKLQFQYLLFFIYEYPKLKLKVK